MENLLENLQKIRITPNFYKEFPETPGIYTYFKDDKVIYIGKAINLRRRVGSYFDLDLEPKTRAMIGEANFISFIKVDSELSALLLEAKLIRKYMPHYNIAAKDDKHPLYIAITKEEFPRITAVRKLMANGYLLLASYGPFPSSSNVKSVLKLIRRIFPFSDHKIGKRGCLYSHIGLCNPCPSEIIGIKDDELRKKYTKIYRKNIRSIKAILDGDIDKLTKNLEKEMSVLSKKQNYEEAAGVRNQISQLEYVTRPQMPTDFYMENPNLYEDIRKKETTALKDLLQKAGKTIDELKRIECFDIAHLAGSSATASMVTFVDAEPDKSLYRHFKIKKARGGDDYDSMREISARRSGHFKTWGKPDLIIVDGGIGQVEAFSEGINSVPIVGIAKHPDRLIVDGQKLELNGPALNLISRMRDEAHRFARRYHHALISKSMKSHTI